jgi:Rap1a immunity proteins
MIGLAMMLTVSISTGNDFYSTCKSSDPLEQVSCVSFMRGVLDGVSVDRIIGKIPPAWCTREGVTNGQLRDVVVKFLENDPSIRDQNAAGIILFAMVGAFPCPKS